jgi:hypothetical protein
MRLEGLLGMVMVMEGTRITRQCPISTLIHWPALAFINLRQKREILSLGILPHWFRIGSAASGLTTDLCFGMLQVLEAFVGCDLSLEREKVYIIYEDGKALG